MIAWQFSRKKKKSIIKKYFSLSVKGSNKLNTKRINGE